MDFFIFYDDVGISTISFIVSFIKWGTSELFTHKALFSVKLTASFKGLIKWFQTCTQYILITLTHPFYLPVIPATFPAFYGSHSMFIPFFIYDLLSLIVEVCVTMVMELSTWAWWAPLYVHICRYWFSLPQNLSVASGFRRESWTIVFFLQIGIVCMCWSLGLALCQFL